MNKGAGLRQDPLAELLIGIPKTSKGPERQEGGFDVLDPGLDPTFFLGISGRTGNQEEAVSLRKLGVRPLDFGVVVGSPDDRALRVIKNDAPGNPNEPLEGLAVKGEPKSDLLVGDNLGILVAGEAECHDEDPGLDQFSRDRMRKKWPSSEVNLSRLPRPEVEDDGCRRVLLRQALEEASDGELPVYPYSRTRARWITVPWTPCRVHRRIRSSWP